MEDSDSQLQQTIAAAQARPAQARAASGISPTPPKKSSRPVPSLFVASAILLLIFGLSGIAGFYLYPYFAGLASNGNKQLGTLDPDRNRSDSKAPIKPDLVAIPGGTFRMGRDGGAMQEGPSHTVTVGSFSMDKTEVTNAEYAEFVKETGHNAPSHFVKGKPVFGQENWPVSNVTLQDAEDFAAWRSKRDGVTYRLPTEEEWEYAARNGDQNNLYPWGNSWLKNRALTRDAEPESLKPVASLPDGKNKWGAVDLIGNVWEWTSSKASIYPGGKEQVPPEYKDWNIIRGGSIMSDPTGAKAISSTYRDWVKPSTTNPYLGFRLVR